MELISNLRTPAALTRERTHVPI